jgi:hypothetical protein
MLTHTRGLFERRRYASAGRAAVGARAAQAHLATIKRFFISALTIAAAATAVAAIMALKVIVYLPRFHY